MMIYSISTLRFILSILRRSLFLGEVDTWTLWSNQWTKVLGFPYVSLNGVYRTIFCRRDNGNCEVRNDLNDLVFQLRHCVESVVGLGERLGKEQDPG